MPSVCDWPLRLVPAERKVRGTALLFEYAIRPATSSESRGRTTALGISRYGLASEA